LGEWLPKPVYANYSLNSSKNGSTSNNLGLSGTLLERNNLSWSVQEGYTSQGRGRAAASMRTGAQPMLNLPAATAMINTAIG
jgi:outer membrane usher protein